MSDDLEQKLIGYGTPKMVEETIKRIKAYKNWEDFKKDYPYGQLINANSIKHIVEEYYNNHDAPTSPPATLIPGIIERNLIERAKNPPAIDGLTYVRTERRPTGSYSEFHGANALETWYIYTNETGQEEAIKTRYGGKRKSRRNRKSKKSRKNLRKSRKNLRKSNCRR
jgi:hypothetical protein